LADGKRCLACTTALVDGQTVGPVEGLPLIRDLVVDMVLDSAEPK
jgi:succinate dehydrogenase/fumarate reductase-like Fe-S protein